MPARPEREAEKIRLQVAHMRDLSRRLSESSEKAYEANLTSRAERDSEASRALSMASYMIEEHEAALSRLSEEIAEEAACEERAVRDAIWCATLTATLPVEEVARVTRYNLDNRERFDTEIRAIRSRPSPREPEAR